MNTEQKCEAILKKIVELNQDINEVDGVLFIPDWGGNSLTIEMKQGHTHCGRPEASWDELVSSLYNLFCENSGLSFHKNS